MKSNFFSRVKSDDGDEIIDPIAQTKNWYSDKYEAVIIQRNILFLFVVVAMIILMFAIFAVNYISTSKSIEPFVVEIDDKSGITTIVNPLTRRDLITNEALNNYFLIKFLRARETYSKVTLENNISIVRVLSSSEVYSRYSRELRDTNNSPIFKYGDTGSTSLKIRSIIYKNDGGGVTVRFSIIEDVSKKSYNKIADIVYTYNQTEMKEEDREINPIGFQITSYMVSDETL